MTTRAETQIARLSDQVVARGGGRFGVGEAEVTVYAAGALCTCSAFRSGVRTCLHIAALVAWQTAQAARPATVISEDSAPLGKGLFLRARAVQDAGRTTVTLEVFDGASLAVLATAEVLPNRLADLVRLIDQMRQKLSPREHAHD
jgi:hypothetical protein